jgi:hypothetical protein
VARQNYLLNKKVLYFAPKIIKMARNKILKLSEEEKSALHEGYLNGKTAVFRMRCHIIVLKNQGYILKTIAALHSYPTQTIYYKKFIFLLLEKFCYDFLMYRNNKAQRFIF